MMRFILYDDEEIKNVCHEIIVQHFRKINLVDSFLNRLQSNSKLSFQSSAYVYKNSFIFSFVLRNKEISLKLILRSS